MHEVLSKYVSGAFWVIDKKSEEELSQVRKLFDDEALNEKQSAGVLHKVLYSGDHDHEFRLLLALGINPDLSTGSSKYRPSHRTTFWGRSACARALAPCRPDLTAENRNGEVPAKCLPVSSYATESVLSHLFYMRKIWGELVVLGVVLYDIILSIFQKSAAKTEKHLEVQQLWVRFTKLYYECTCT